MTDRCEARLVWPLEDIYLSDVRAYKEAETDIPRICRENGWTRVSDARRWEISEITETDIVVSCVIDVLIADRDSYDAIAEAPLPEFDLAEVG